MAFTFNDLLEKAKKGGKVVADKASDLTEQARITAALINERSELDTLYKELGRLVYFASKNEDNIDLEESFAKIDEKREKIQSLEDKSNEIKGTKICSVCGKKCDSDAQYCSTCGNKL